MSGEVATSLHGVVVRAQSSSEIACSLSMVLVRTNIDPPPPGGDTAGNIGYIWVEDWLGSGDLEAEPAAAQFTLEGKVPLVEIK